MTPSYLSPTAFSQWLSGRNPEDGLLASSVLCGWNSSGTTAGGGHRWAPPKATSALSSFPVLSSPLLLKILTQIPLPRNLGLSSASRDPDQDTIPHKKTSLQLCSGSPRPRRRVNYTANTRNKAAGALDSLPPSFFLSTPLPNPKLLWAAIALRDL